MYEWAGFLTFWQLGLHHPSSQSYRTKRILLSLFHLNHIVYIAAIILSRNQKMRYLFQYCGSKYVAHFYIIEDVLALKSIVFSVFVLSFVLVHAAADVCFVVPYPPVCQYRLELQA